MSEIPAPNYDDGIKHLKEIADREVRAGKLSAEEAAKLLDETIERWKETVRNWPQIVKRMQNGAFAAQLAARQGTHIPDFEAFYREREKLDRTIFRPDQAPSG